MVPRLRVGLAHALIRREAGCDSISRFGVSHGCPPVNRNTVQ